jgi:L-ascorbate metabolism protein UlaG (beta-lactamase superfamily)
MIVMTINCPSGLRVQLYTGILLAAMVALSGCSNSRQRQQLDVTLIANAGFLIECNHQKILIDALFGGFESDWCVEPSDSVVDLMVNAKPPFDNINIIAFTHYHIDHFNPEMTISHLLHNRSGTVVCTRQVDQMLAKSDHYPEIRNRIKVVTVPLDSAEIMSIGGIEVKAIRTRHLPSGVIDEATGKTVDGNLKTEHLEFVFTLGGNIIYHSGDATMDSRPLYQSYGFGAHSIDLAFLHWWDASERLSFRQVLVREIIRPDRIVLMHVVKGPSPIDKPEWQALIAKQVILPKRPMEKWTFRKLENEPPRD